MRTSIVRIAISAALFSLLTLFADCRDKKNPAAPTGYNLDATPPRFVRENFIDASKMARISKFRSAVGGDYSDGAENCRSMKHYFEPRDDFDWSTLSLHSPVPGKVTKILGEPVGKQVSIQSLEYPDFEFHLFHVEPLDSLSVGMILAAGQRIGTHAGRQTASEIAVSVNSTKGWRLISYFDVITDSLFRSYGLCGVNLPRDFIIDREARDADPLACDGSGFTTTGHLENWIVMNCHWDVDSWGIPRFVDVNYIDFERIAKISKFRSSVGHDYSDDFEHCRSMKHYFWLDGDSGWENARLYAPVNGTVSWRFEEWLGTQVWIRSDDYPDFQFGIFHVVLQDSTLSEGRAVTAGQWLGTHFGTRTYSDIAVTVTTPGGRKLISYFDVMSDALFQRYQARGLSNRNDVIISMQERDTWPLTCTGETFVSGTGTLEDWVTLR